VRYGISVLDVAFKYPGHTSLMFRDLRFRLDSSTRIAIVGPNGSGKSTLLRLMTGHLTPTSGEVSRHNKCKIGRFDQHFEELLPLDTSTSACAFLMETYSLEAPEARKWLGMFGLDGPRHLIKLKELSGGQKARVVLASLALSGPDLLILDEPTNHLDLESVDALIQALKAFQGGVILVSHDSRVIEAVGCELWVCEGLSPRQHGTGLRVERRGLAQYRRSVSEGIMKRAEEAEAKARARALQRKRAREKRLSKHSTGGGGRNRRQQQLLAAPKKASVETGGAADYEEEGGDDDGAGPNVSAAEDGQLQPPPAPTKAADLFMKKKKRGKNQKKAV